MKTVSLRSAAIVSVLASLAYGQCALAGPDEDKAASKCDDVAAATDDATNPPGIKGVATSDLDATVAVAVCEKAAAAFPDKPRFSFQYGRALRAAGDEPKSFQMIKTAAEAGHAAAMNHLGYYFDEGIGTQENDAEAVKWYTKAAEQGVAWAQNNLGLMYENGTGVKRDYAKAAEWLNKSAAQNLPAGINSLGQLYEKGLGVPIDDAKAFNLYDKAAGLGNADAINNLAMTYDDGRGVKQDLEMAATLYQKAIKAGSVEALGNLGWMYDRGVGGLPLNHEKANELYREAADKGDSNSMSNYAESLLTGEGVTQNIPDGLEWTKKAIEAGSFRAAYNMGKYYAAGDYVKADPEQAAKYFILALERNSGEARSLLVAHEGEDLSPAVRNALQEALLKRGASFQKGDGKLSAGAIAYMQAILQGE